MEELLFNLLVDKTKPESEEIKRLAKFRGLNFPIEETDIRSFLNKYFSKDSVPNITKDFDSRFEKWAKSFAAKPLWGIPIDPLCLEPFIARYVNAVNAIGAKTSSSCDGWHNEKKEHDAHIIFKDRYSRIWHKLMCERLSGTRAKWSLFRGNVVDLYLPRSDEGKIKAYTILNKNAEEFENRREELLLLKVRLIDKLKRKQKSTLTDEEIEKLFIETLKEIEKE